MDFGFGAILEKIEEHFGPWVLRPLLVLIGLAVALFCANLIWQLALGPLVQLATGALEERGLVDKATQVLWGLLGVVLSILTSSILISRLVKWETAKQLIELKERTEELGREVQDRLAGVGRLDPVSKTSLEAVATILERTENLLIAAGARRIRGDPPE